MESLWALVLRTSLACRPSLAETRSGRNAKHSASVPKSFPCAHVLLSFERPAAGVPRGCAFRRTLKTAQLAELGIEVPGSDG